jgi:gliding motility-associated-like protein
VSQQPTCAVSTGTIRVTAPSGTGYSYSIDNGTSFQASATFASVDPGTYSVIARNSFGCTSPAVSVTVNNAPPGPAAPAATVTQQPTCAAPAGTIVVSSPLGIGFTYSLDGSNYQSSPTFSGVTPGTYNLTANNTLGCVSTATSVTVNGPPAGPPAPAASVTLQPTCLSPRGTIRITAPIATGYTYSINGVSYQSLTNFNNVVAGTYNVTVKNSSGCISSATSVTVNRPPSPPSAPSAIVTQPTCTTPTGTIRITAPAGAGFTYSIDGLNFQSSSVFAGLQPAVYNVTVRNSGDCASFATYTVNAVPGGGSVAPSASVTRQPTCATPTGTITVTAPTGAGYTYSINGNTYQAATTFSEVAPGTYNVTAKNTNGCTSVATAVTVNAPPSTAVPSASVTQQPTCSTPTGTITITASTGTGYTYSINGSTYQASTIFSGVAPGVYNVTVKDGGGCISGAITVTVNGAPSAISITVNSAAVCTGADANITATVAPQGSYTYSWTVPGGAANPGNVSSFTASVAGNYTVTVSNGGCSASATGTVTVTAQAQVSADNKEVCSGSSVLLTGQPSGGTWSGTGVSGSTFNAASLAAGNYTVTYSYQGSASCSGTATATIKVNALPAAPVASATQQPSCTSPTGTITVSAPSPAANISYSVNGSTYQASNIFTGLAAGTYNVTVKDAGCVSPITSVVLTQGSPATVVATASPTGCGQATGAINISAANGTAPYSYSIDGTSFQTSNLFNSLSAGNYTITVKDATGCIANVSVAVTQQNSAILASTVTAPANSGQSNGSIIVTASNGIAPYSYSINGGGFQVSNTFNNLAAGSYTITVKDASGCTVTVSADVGETTLALTATASAPPIRCGESTGVITITASGGASPYTYSLNGGTYVSLNTFGNLTAGTYNIKVKDAVGTTFDVTATLTQIGSNITATAAAPAIPCGQTTGRITVTAANGTMPYSYSIDGGNFQSSNVFSSIAAGNHIITVKDAVGCTASASAILTQLTSTVTASAFAPPIPCGQTSGTITVTSANGTAPYTYSIDGVNFQLSNIFSPIAAGNYTITVKDAAGCTGTTTANLTRLYGFSLKLEASPNPVLAGRTVIAQSGAPAVYQILAWQPSSIFSNQNSKAQSFAPDTSITISVIAKTGNGCIDTAFADIIVIPLNEIYVPTAFTPNGDGKNDVLKVFGSSISEMDLSIYNRLGQVVFRTTDKQKGWDGTFGGVPQPNNVYVYMLKVKKSDGKIVERKGTITLMR